MSVRPILPWPHKLLSERSAPIPDFGDHAQNLLKALCQDMFDTVAAADGRGLSAIQIGAKWRVIYIAKQIAGEPLYMVNPVIASHGEILQHMPEGCMSTPTIDVDIQRWASIRVRAQKINGDEFTIPAYGVLAQAIQHELNHLEGKTVIECANRSKRWFYRDKLKRFGGASGKLIDYGSAQLAHG